MVSSRCELAAALTLQLSPQHPPRPLPWPDRHPSPGANVSSPLTHFTRILHTHSLQVWSGFYVSYEDAGFWQWVYTINPYYRVIASVSRINLQDYSTQECPASASESNSGGCAIASSGNLMLDTVGFRDTSVELNLLLLFVFWLVYWLTGWLFLSLDAAKAAPITRLSSLCCPSRKQQEPHPGATKRVELKARIDERLQSSSQSSEPLRLLAAELLKAHKDVQLPADVVDVLSTYEDQRPSASAVRRASIVSDTAERPPRRDSP